LRRTIDPEPNSKPNTNSKFDAYPDAYPDTIKCAEHSGSCPASRTGYTGCDLNTDHQPDCAANRNA
jgi:hypothetical protein